MSDSLVLRLALLLVLGAAPALPSTIRLTVQGQGFHPSTGYTGERIDLETTTASSLTAVITQLGPIAFDPSAQPTASYDSGVFRLSGIEAICLAGQHQFCALWVGAEFYPDPALEGAAVMQASGTLTDAASTLGEIYITSFTGGGIANWQQLAITQMPWPDGPFTFSQSIAHTITETVFMSAYFHFAPGGAISIPGSLTFSFPALQVPEPGSGVLVLLGFALLVLRARRRSPGYHYGRNG
ncbi:MAG TPA: PEP-CTERM sorting domain-containing protein [Bryobacteraceae bacterium]|nr:hypothetical protein [Bryobacterales bacterium]HRJ21073.1 PEP-CTERM sorting domain-containing protein [Bryobacteraceae bacterium]